MKLADAFQLPNKDRASLSPPPGSCTRKRICCTWPVSQRCPIQTQSGVRGHSMRWTATSITRTSALRAVASVRFGEMPLTRKHMFWTILFLPRSWRRQKLSRHACAPAGWTQP